MTVIKLDYETVIQTLEEIDRVIGKLSLPSLSPDTLGQNQLNFTTQWLLREETIHTLVTQYKEVVLKNVDDTKANVDLLKEQDETMVKK